MADKQIFRFVHIEARRRAAAYCMVAPEGSIAKFQDADRTLEQNAAQWPILQCFAKQKQWPVNGVLEWITDEEYKDILTAAFYQENVRLAAGLDGGVVMLGRRTSKTR
ncbi:MAG: recombination protein NinB [Nitrosomonas sp.]|nr:recombination protein NinB [Nitrosomonas sp.]